MDPAYQQRYLRLEDHHWWFVARRALVRRLAHSLVRVPRASSKHPPDPGATTGPWQLVEVGCGSAATLLALQRDTAPNCRLIGVEASETMAFSRTGAPCVFDAGGPPAQRFDRPKRAGLTVVLADAGDLPLADESCDGALCLDVLEHLADDGGAARELWRVLKPKGRVLITVPAFMALWGPHDEVNRHYRRYRLRALRGLFPNRARVLLATYWSALAAPVVFAVRTWQRALGAPARDDFAGASQSAAAVMNAVLTLENALVARGFRLAVGSTALLALEKPGPEPHED